MKKKKKESLLSVKMLCFNFANIFKVQYEEIVVCFWFVWVFLFVCFCNWNTYLLGITCFSKTSYKKLV